MPDNPSPPPEACPRCHSNTAVVSKLLLINPVHARHAVTPSIWRDECPCKGGFSVDDLKPELAHLGQFVHGLFCQGCGVGFVPEDLAKPAPPRYESSPGGWRRVYADGTRGPLLERMADDPVDSL